MSHDVGDAKMISVGKEISLKHLKYTKNAKITEIEQDCIKTNNRFCQQMIIVARDKHYL
jgi:predicted thioesterase